MSSIASLIVKIGADKKEIDAALTAVGVKASALGNDLKKIGNAPIGDKARQSLDSLKASMKAITDAQERIAERGRAAAVGIDQMGGAARLTDAQLKQVNKTLQEGVSAYRALEKDVPADLQRIAAETKNATATTEGWKASLKGLAGAIGAAFTVGAVVNFGRDILRLADDIVRVSDRTGLMTDEVQQLGYIATQSGNSLDEMTGAVGQLQNRLSSGDKSAVSAVKQLNLNLKELRESSPYDQLRQIANAISGIEDPAKRAQLAMDLFGRTGIAILPSLTSEFEKLGNAAPKMAESTVRSLEAAGDAIETFQLQVKVWAAESYNNARSFFDRMIVLGLRFQASFSEMAATVAERGQFLLRMAGTVAQMLPGGGALAGAVQLVGGDPAKLREQATFLRDSAKAMEELIAAETKGVEATQKRGVVIGETDQAMKDAEASARRLKDVQDQLFGRAIIANAELLVKALGSSDNLTKLTAESTQKLNQELGQAIAIYKQLGDQVPAQLQEIYEKTRQLQQTPVAPPLEGFLMFSREAGDVIRTGRDFSKILSSTGIEVNKLGNAVKVNLAPSLDGLTKTFDEGASKAEGFLSSLKGSLGGLNDIFQSAFEGGGGVGGAIKSLATDLLQKGLAMIPVVGEFISQFAGAIVAGVKKLWDAVSGRGGRNLVKEFGKQFDGGLNGLREKLNALGAEGERLWQRLHGDAGDAEGAKRAIDDVTAALAKAEEQFQTLQGAVGDISEKFSAITVITPELQAGLDAVFNAKSTGEYLDAVSKINTELDKQAQKYSDVEAALQKYGLGFERAGKSFQQAKLNERAQELNKDFHLLIESGTDINATLRAMGPSIRDFVKDAQIAGVEVPSSMQKIIQSAIDAGELFDENGEKITDISQLGLTFGTTMETVAKTVGSAIQRLNQILEGLAKFLGITLPAAAEKGAAGIEDALSKIDVPDIDVNVDYHTSGLTSQDELERKGYAASGGVVKPWGIQHFAGGGVARGTDTVPAMLTPGEIVLNAAQQQNVAGAMGGGTVNITFTGTVLAAREYVERELIDPILDGISRNGMQRFSRLVAQAGAR